MCNHRRYLQLVPWYRYLSGGCRDYQQRSGCRYHGNQIFHCDRADASAVRTRCCCDNHRHRHGILQSVIYRMRYYLRCFICTYFPVPAARFWAEGRGQIRGTHRQLKTHKFFVWVHRHDRDWFHLHRYLPVMVKLRAELRKRKCRLGEPVHHADLLFRRYPDGARCHLPADP